MYPLRKSLQLKPTLLQGMMVQVIRRAPPVNFSTRVPLQTVEVLRVGNSWDALGLAGARMVIQLSPTEPKLASDLSSSSPSASGFH